MPPAQFQQHSNFLTSKTATTNYKNFDESMLSDEMLRLANGGNDEEVKMNADNDNDNLNVINANALDEMEDGSVVVRTMEVPRWLSNPDVTSELILLFLCLVVIIRSLFTAGYVICKLLLNAVGSGAVFSF